MKYDVENKTVECREVILDRKAVVHSCANFARSEWGDCGELISASDDGYGGKILLFVKKEP